MGNTSKPSEELEAKAAVDEIEPSSPTGDAGLREEQTDVTTGTDGEPSPAAEVSPTPSSNRGSTAPAKTPLPASSDEPTTSTDRVTDDKVIERLLEEKAEGGSCSETQPTEKQSTHKRKRPDQPFVISKRQKTALFSPMEIELQCLVQMFDALRL